MEIASSSVYMYAGTRACLIIGELKMLIKRQSQFSGKTNVMDLDITDEQIRVWQGGTNIQNAMPNLTAEEREFLMTGTTQEEWNAMFGKEEE